MLRGHDLSDFAESAAMWGDPAVTAHITPTPFSAEQTWSRLLRYAGHWLHLGYGYWVVETKADGRFIGEVGFADYRRDTRPSLVGRPEAGWAFRSDVHGHGYATEAVAAMLRWADRNLDAAATACIFDPNHAASIRVAEKVGYGNPHLGDYAGQETLFMERTRRRA